MADLSDSSDPSTAILTVCSSIPSSMPGKGPQSSPSTPRKRKITPPPSSRPMKLATPSGSKKLETISIQNIHNYHGLGKKRLGNFHSPGSLKRYAEAEFQKLQVSFEEEIAKVKATGIPLAQDITFSNIDDLIVDALERLETEKQTLTNLRNVIVMYGKTIAQIAEDLQEEIGYVLASEQEGGDENGENEGGEEEEGDIIIID
ncbi:hypothetical protein TWF506_009639 [Arthrobotrys conoides]|uniref:Uncharacterized protein n=1 Tax=Arthrobotrys conoides TaxID=74498 RepID=A0AAN8NBW5_9PEZI